MRLGIKVGPDSWHKKLDNDLHIQYAEVYFDLARREAYTPMFAWLRAHHVKAGLHVSTRLQGGLVPNLATDDENVRRASTDVVQQTLNVAAEQKLEFVVLHPGSYRLQAIRGGRTCAVGRATSAQTGNKHVTEQVLALVAYGRTRGVELWIENLPRYDYASYHPRNRQEVIDVKFVPHTQLDLLGARGVGLCLDIGHLVAEFVHEAGCTKELFWQVMTATRALAPYVRHLHVSTVTPPWNGTDSHDGFLEADYERGAIPTREQLVTWLQVLAEQEAQRDSDRPLWVIPEPSGNAEVHLANHSLLRTWMEQVS